MQEVYKLYMNECLPSLTTQSTEGSGGKLQRIARRVLGLANADGETGRQITISETLASWLRSTELPAAERIAEFEGLPLDEIDHKLLGAAAVWQIREAYDVLIQRRAGAFNTEEDAFSWFHRLGFSQYGDLMHS